MSHVCNMDNRLVTKRCFRSVSAVTCLEPPVLDVFIFYSMDMLECFFLFFKNLKSIKVLTAFASCL